MELDGQPLLRCAVIDPGPRRNEAVAHAGGQFLERPEDGFLAGRQLDPVHAASSVKAVDPAEDANFVLTRGAFRCMTGWHTPEIALPASERQVPR